MLSEREACDDVYISALRGRDLSTSWTRNLACLSIFSVFVAVLLGCGSSDSNLPASGGAVIRVELAKGGFSPNTPSEFQVSSGELITVEARALDAHKYSLGVLAPTMAQTFKIAPNGSQTITISKLEHGESAQLIVGKQRVSILAPGGEPEPAASEPTEPTSAKWAPPAQTTSTGGAPAQSEADTVPVDLRLAGGGFAAGTPRTFHVPAGFAITVTAVAGDARPYRVTPVPAAAGAPIAVPAKGRGSAVFDALKPGGSFRLTVGGRAVKVVADADPGP